MRKSGISRFMWLLPVLMLALSAPLWLHIVEPATFIALNTLCAPLHATLWTGLSLLGNAWGILGLTAPLLVLAPRLLWAWLCAAPFAILFTRLGKGWIESARPAAVIDHAQIRIVGETLYTVSMPSGHTLTAFAVASGIYFSLPLARRWRHAWLFVLATGTGLSRIAVGAHWPGDVAVGASLGLLSGMLGQSLLQRIPRHWMDPMRWPLRLVAAVQALAMYVLLSDTLDFSENQPPQWILAAGVAISLGVFVQRSLRRKP